MFNLKSRRNKKSAFTLIELLVVILILGILIAVAIPLYLSSVRNAGTRTTEANLKTLAQAAQAFRVKTGSYPTALTDGAVSTPPSAGVLNEAGDLEQIPSGPGGVTYSIASTSTTSQLTLQADEPAAGDVFGTAGQGETMTYNLQTGAFLVVP